MKQTRTYERVLVREVRIEQSNDLLETFGTRRIVSAREAETRVELLSHEPLVGFAEALRACGPVKITIEWG